jgi:hypothetical protein
LPGRPLLDHSTSAVLMKRLHHLGNAGRAAELLQETAGHRSMVLATRQSSRQILY